MAVYLGAAGGGKGSKHNTNNYRRIPLHTKPYTIKHETPYPPLFYPYLLVCEQSKTLNTVCVLTDPTFTFPLTKTPRTLERHKKPR